MSGLDSVLEELRGLRRELGDLAQRVTSLEAARGETSRLLGSPSSPVTVNYSFASPVLPGASPYPSGTGSGSDQQLPVPVASASAGVGAEDSPDERFRSQVASGIGRFFARALAGNHRGGSGRDQVKLPSVIYVVCQDFSGKRYNPVFVSSSFAAIRGLVKPRGDCGNSVFAGFPSAWEAQTAVRSAGLVWPADGSA